MTSQGWRTKQHELAFRWDVDDYTEVSRPNPLSTAPVKLQFVGGTWQYRAVLTSSQKRERYAVITSLSIPVQLAFAAGVVVQLVVLHFVDQVPPDPTLTELSIILLAMLTRSSALDGIHQSRVAEAPTRGEQAIDDYCPFQISCGLPNQHLSQYGQVMFYAFLGIQALVINVLNAIFEAVAVWLTNLENHTTVASYDFWLAVRIIFFQVFNCYRCVL